MKNTLFHKISFLSSAVLYIAFIPRFVFAAMFADIVNIFIGTLQAMVAPLVALGVAVFFYGIVKYIASEGSSESKGEGKMIMVWGIVGLFIMISIWGILRMLALTFQL